MPSSLRRIAAGRIRPSPATRSDMSSRCSSGVQHRRLGPSCCVGSGLCGMAPRLRRALTVPARTFERAMLRRKLCVLRPTAAASWGSVHPFPSNVMTSSCASADGTSTPLPTAVELGAIARIRAAVDGRIRAGGSTPRAGAPATMRPRVLVAMSACRAIAARLKPAARSTRMCARTCSPGTPRLARVGRTGASYCCTVPVLQCNSEPLQGVGTVLR